MMGWSFVVSLLGFMQGFRVYHSLTVRAWSSLLMLCVIGASTLALWVDADCRGNTGEGWDVRSNWRMYAPVDWVDVERRFYFLFCDFMVLVDSMRSRRFDGFSLCCFLESIMAVLQGGLKSVVGPVRMVGYVRLVCVDPWRWVHRVVQRKGREKREADFRQSAATVASLTWSPDQRFPGMSCPGYRVGEITIQIFVWDAFLYFESRFFCLGSDVRRRLVVRVLSLCLVAWTFSRSNVGSFSHSRRG